MRTDTDWETAEPQPATNAWHPDLHLLEGNNAILYSSRTVIVDKSDVPMLLYLPAYLENPSSLGKPFDEFIASHPPTVPGTDDSRHSTSAQLPGEAELETYFEGRYGTYHIGTWTTQGQAYLGPHVSRETHQTCMGFMHVCKLFSRLEALTVAMSIVYAALDYVSWRRALAVISTLNHLVPGSRVLRTSIFDAWSCRAILANVFTHAHVDAGDWKGGYAAITVFGSFTGGEFVVPDFRIKFPFQPGDVVFIKSHLLRHLVMPWTPCDGENGGRISVVHFNPKAVVAWADQKVR